MMQGETICFFSKIYEFNCLVVKNMIKLVSILYIMHTYYLCKSGF